MRIFQHSLRWITLTDKRLVTESSWLMPQQLRLKLRFGVLTADDVRDPTRVARSRRFRWLHLARTLGSAINRSSISQRHSALQHLPDTLGLVPFKYSSTFCIPSRSLSAEPSRSRGFKPWRCSHLSGIPSPSVSAGGVVTLANQPPTWFAIDDGATPLPYFITIRASTESVVVRTRPPPGAPRQTLRGHWLG
jgi:hypothetical protein